MSDRQHADELLSAHLDGELDAEEERWVAGHLEECVECRRTETDLRTARERLRDPAPVDAGPVVARFLARHRAAVRTGAAFVGVAAVALAALALTSAVLRPPVVPDVDALTAAHRAVSLAGFRQPAVPGGVHVEPVGTMHHVSSVAVPYAAPPAMLGSEVRLSRHVMLDGSDLTAILYRDGSSAVSVFQQPGSLRWEQLPDGALEVVGRRTVWLREGTPAVMVTEVGDVVVTVVSDDRAAMTTVVEGLPASERSSTWDRLHDACVRFTRSFAAS